MGIRLFNASVVLLLLLTMLASGSVSGGVSALGNQPSEIPVSRSTLAGDPSLESISPSSFAGGVNVPVLITGQNLDGTASALLGTVAMRNVEVISSTQVTALVPWSIAPGTYDLTTTNQGGQSAVLVDAVTVSAPAPGWISSGPFGGDLNDVVVDPVDPSRMYVSAGRSGLWRSQNGGVNWDFSLVTPFPARLQITYPVTGQPPVMYLGIDIGAGMVRSLDYGQTWEAKGPPSINGETRAYIRPGQPGWVYLSVDQNQDGDPLGGLYQSTDLGETWAIVSGTSGLRVEAVAFDPDHPDLNMVIGTGDGQVYTTTDNGVTWSDPITVANQIGQLCFSPTLYDGKRSLWAIPSNYEMGSDQDDTVYQSTDGGQTWTPVQIAAGVQNHGLAFHDSILGLMWAAVGDGYYSEDGGATWHPVGAGLYRVQSFAVVPGATSRQTTTLFAATKGHLYKSTDGGDTWQETDTGIGAELVRTIAISPFNADEAYIATHEQGVLHTFDGGRSWQSLPIPMGSYGASIAPDPFTDGQVFFGYGSYEPVPMVRVSADHGETYTEHALALPPEYADKEAYVSAIAPDPSTQDRLLAGVSVAGNWPAIGPGFIYASIDGGSTWSQQSTPAGVKCALHIAYDPQDADVVYAATKGTGLLRSADGGATWTPTAAQPAGTELGAVIIDPRDTLSIYVSSAGNISSGNASDNGVFVTHDGGAHWVKMEGLTDYPIWDLKLVRVGTGYWLYAATMNGLRYLKIPVDPSTPWERGGGVSETATIDGLNAGVEDKRVVLYIGTSGGTLPSSLASLAGPAGANSSQLIAGGVYRSMMRIHLVYLPIVLR